MAPLRTRALGESGIEITTLGFGTWALGGPGWAYTWGPQDDRRSLAAMRRAIALGINWIDTAPAYGLGHAETLVGRLLRELPRAERPLVFTKCGLVFDPTDPSREPRRDLRPQSIRCECEASLERLGVEAIDLYQFHHPDDTGTPLEYSWEEMTRLFDEGKIRAAGVCNFDVGALTICGHLRHVDSLQTPFSLIRREAALAEIPWCAQRGTAVLAYSPMHSGLLSGAFSEARMARLARDDWRRTNPEFQPPHLGRNLALAHALRPIARRHGVKVGAVAVAWSISWPGVTAAIVGARAPRQVDDWIKAATLELSAEDAIELAGAIGHTKAGAGPARPEEIETWQWEVGVQE